MQLLATGTVVQQLYETGGHVGQLPKKEEDVNGRKVGMVFKTKKGSPSLVALYNMCTFYLSTVFGVNRDLTEKEIKHIIGDVIKERCSQSLHGVLDDHLKDVLKTTSVAPFVLNQACAHIWTSRTVSHSSYVACWNSRYSTCGF